MNKTRKRTASTIITMAIVAVVIILLYGYWIVNKDPFNKDTETTLSETELLLQKDLEKDYPETPREVVKYYSKMLKLLYSELEDSETEALAYKIRELFDQEFIENTPEDEYLMNLYTDISKWKEDGRRITNFILVNEELETKENIDGREYADVYVSYTLQEKGKFSQTLRFLLRLSEEEQWKILGWTYVPKEEE